MIHASLWTAITVATPALGASDVLGPEPSPAEDVSAVEPIPSPDPVPVKWYPIAIPTPSFNSVDGFGIGLGGEAHSRRVDRTFGYEWMISFSLFTTVSGNYQAHWVRFDRQGSPNLAGLVGFKKWTDLRYAGAGGEAVARELPRAVEGKNTVQGPYGFFGVTFPVDGSIWSPFAQVYARGVWSRPSADSLLLEERAPGLGGGTYIDLTGGVVFERLDRWPLPSKGYKGEISVSAGLAALPQVQVAAEQWQDEDVLWNGNIHAEWIGWYPITHPRWTLGARAVVDKTVGKKPFFEQDILGGKWRDELGADQILTGYGRTRTRGDGVAAALIEFRPMLFDSKHRTWDIDLYLSGYAEVGWLFDGFDPGPVMPTVGFAPEVVWQSAFQIRPFVAWGWRERTPGDPRRPMPTFGISFLDPL